MLAMARIRREAAASSGSGATGRSNPLLYGGKPVRFRKVRADGGRMSHLLDLRFVSLLLSLFLLLSAAFAGCSQQEAAGADEAHKPSAAARSGTRQPPPVPVLADEVRRTDVPDVLHVVGTVEPIASVVVRPLVGGPLTRVHFREGQDVRRGDVLFTIDPRPWENAVRQAEAVLARDRIQAEQARQDEQRYAELAAKDYATREQHEKLRAAAAASEAQLRLDQVALDHARLQLSYCTVRAPIDGRTGSLLVDEGNVVRANEAELVSIQQIEPIQVAFAVPEGRLPEIRRALRQGPVPVRARLQAAPQAAALTGELAFVENRVDPSTGTVLLRATFANPDAVLWPGQLVRVELTISTLPQVAVVPASALQAGQQGSFVYVVRPDDTVEARPVTPGIARGQETVIEQGLAPGELVVTDGQLRLVPGARVQVRRPDAAAAAVQSPPPAGAAAKPAVATEQQP